MNEVLFSMVKKVLIDTYSGGTTTTALQNEVSKFWKIHYDKYNQVMVNQLVNDFYARFFFKIDALPRDGILPLYIAATLSNKLIPDIREFFIP